MDKVISARLNESIVCLIDRLAHKLHISKKKLLEDAVTEYATRLKEDESVDIFAETSGSWQRKTTPAALRTEIRKKFDKTIKRHYQ